MKNVIPFTKELEFTTKISEITSISLERDFTVKENCIDGNLYVTGEYKSHEVSVNVVPFSFKIPFTIDITNPIDKDTVSLEISDFAYDIIDNSKIKVHVELEFSCEEKEIEKVEDNGEEIIEMLESESSDERNSDELLEDEMIIEEASLAKEEVVENKEEEKEEIKEEVVEDSSTQIIEEKKEEVEDDEYLTYHIHILKEGETLETLCSMYHTTGEYISEYNDITTLNPGDKILIPMENE